MSSVRWNSPFNHSIPYLLFSKHFTELNNVYWAYVPASSTIEKKSYEYLKDPTADPRKYFLIPDEDDHRLANTYSDWKKDFRAFGNYTRLNMIMLLSSVFETYLRTIVSLAIESKPGALLGCSDKIDGAFLLKTKNGYGDTQCNDYMFSSVIDGICKGDWNKRATNYKKYFVSFPVEIDIQKLDELRNKRNSIGHFFGRKKEDYETTYSPEVIQPILISPKSVKEYLKIVNTTVIKIDQHLHREFIGSYDVLKYFYFYARNKDLITDSPPNQAKELKKQLGRLGMQTVGKDYYTELLEFFSLQDENCVFKYSKHNCVNAINKRLTKENITVIENGSCCEFSEYHFRLFCRNFSANSNKEYCEIHTFNNGSIFFYSEKFIDFIVLKVKDNPAIIDDLKKRK